MELSVVGIMGNDGVRRSGFTCWSRIQVDLEIKMNSFLLRTKILTAPKISKAAVVISAGPVTNQALAQSEGESVCIGSGLDQS
jgi:hypothetical protein